MQINITYDASVSGAPAGFTAAVDAAVAYYEDNFDAPITVNITIGWGTAAADEIPDGALGATFTSGYYFSYEEIRNALWADAETANALTAAMSLPAADPTNGGVFFMTSAQAKALGLVPTRGVYSDGTIVMDTTSTYTFDPNNRLVAGKVDAIGVLEHEIGHVLGRVSYLGEALPGGVELYGALDLFRYSAPGTLSPAGAATYFSIDGQNLLLPFNDPANGGTESDWSINLTGDVFDAFAGDGELLQFSQTDLTMLDVFGFHPHVAPPTTPAPTGPTLNNGAVVDDGAQIPQGLTVYFTGLQGYTLRGSLTNAGTIINATDNGGGWTIDIDQHVAIPRNAVFTNTATGSVMVTNSGYSTSYAFVYTTAIGTGILNAGLIQSVSTGGDAYGVDSASIFGNFTNTATGIVRVWAKYNARGVVLTGAASSDGGAFNNAGLIEVYGDNDPGDPAHGIAPTTGATGVIGGSPFNNSGTIKVISGYGDTPSVGVLIWHSYPTGGLYTNSGTIIADYAFSDGDGKDVNIVNSGKLIGAIALGDGNDQIHNTGIIAGDIFFGNSTNLYAGIGGHLYGNIYLGYGANTITLSGDGNTVYGGGSADTINGGAGNDSFMIARGDNHLNGGGGTNTLSLQSAAGRYTVNLGSGTAAGAGTTSFTNIQRVIGSEFGDTLIAGSSAATLIGGGGQTTLVGGAGNDTLVADTGGDTATGNGGNDIFIYTAGDHQLVINDFLANGNQDVLNIFGYGSALSTQQQGADTLITLSGNDKILLKNVLTSSLGSSVVFNAGDYFPPVTSLPQPVWGSRPAHSEALYTYWMFVDYALKIYGNEHVTMDFGPPVDESQFRPGHYGITMGTATRSGVATSLDNFGQISAISNGGSVSGIKLQGDVEEGSVFSNEAGASFTVTNANGEAWGIDGNNVNVFTSPDILNAGDFRVTASGAIRQATGAYTWDSNFSFNNTATGTFAVTSNDSWAYGLELHNAGVFRNDGQFTVSGKGTVYGVWEDHFDFTDPIVNNGIMTVSGASGSDTYGFFLRGSDDVQLSPISFINTGTISAKTAIQAIHTVPGFSPAQAPSLDIQNSGTINGDINLGGSRSRLSNTGTINGNILIHDDYAGFNYFYVNYGPGRTIDLRGGQFNGYVGISAGFAGDASINDVIYTGTATTTVKITGGQSLLTATIRASLGGLTTIDYDMASSGANWINNADGSWTVSAGDHGTETLFDVAALHFTDRTVRLADVVPLVATTNVAAQRNQTFALSSLFTVSDADGDPITQYQLWDSTNDPNSGHFVINGQVQAAGVAINVTAAQLPQTSFVTGRVNDVLQIRAFDGISWSAAYNAAWAPFTVSVPANNAPVLTTSNRTISANQTLALSSLFSLNDAEGDSITTYQLWDSGRDPNSGHFVVNGQIQAAGTIIDVTAGQLASASFVTGTVGDSLQIRAFDGLDWSAAANASWAPFTVTPPINHLPVVTTQNLTKTPGQTLALSGLLTVNDADGDTITLYELWDGSRDPSSGHFVVNGVDKAAGTIISVAAGQLAQVSFVTGSVADSLQIRAFDGTAWSAADTAAWSPFAISPPVNHPPAVTTANVTRTHLQTLALSSLFSLSDPDGDPAVKYQIWDSGRDPNSGHFVVNGVDKPAGTIIEITAAQLAQTSFVTGTVGDGLQIRAFDGISWSAADDASWSPFTVSVPDNLPVVTTSNATKPHLQSVALSSLFSVNDADGDTITKYQLWDSTRDPNSGHFVVAGVDKAASTIIEITAAQLAQTSFVTGTVGDSLQIRAFDGYDWSAPDTASWAPFNLSVSNHAPAVSTQTVNAMHGRSLALSSLFSVTDADSDSMTKYQLWDSTRDPNSGHFVVNGVDKAAGTIIEITAAQLAQTSFVTGTVSDSLQIRTFDGMDWSDGDNAAWQPFTVTVATPYTAPIASTHDINTTPGQSLTSASLFSVTDADGDSMTRYQLWDSTADPNSGHFVVNGQAQAASTVIDLTAAQFAQTSFLTGTVDDSLQIRAFDGVSWTAADTAAWAPFHINV